MKRICSIITLIYLLGLLPVAVFGQLGSNALRFDGTDDYVSIPHNAALNVSAVTIEMWFKWENYTTPADVDFLIGKDFEQLEIHTGGGAGNNALRFIPTTGVYLDTPPNSFTPGNWYHVAFMYDPAGATKYACYINGASVSLSAIGTVTTAIYTSAEPLKIGIRQGLVTPFQGYIDEVRIWNTARTQAEIQAAQNTELAGNETGLVAYYKMNEGTGTTVDDASPNSNTGTLMSGVAWSGMFYLVNDLTSGLTGMSGATFKWYSTDYPGGTLYTGTESLVNGQKYYATQTVNGVESTARKEVTAIVNTQTATPTVTLPILFGATSVSGTCESGATVKVYVNGANPVNAITTSTTWTATFSALSAGNIITAYATASSKCISQVSSSATVNSVAVGNDYLGGKVAYIFVDGDQGYVAGQTHGLIAATADQGDGYGWSISGNYTISVSTGTAIGTGSANTSNIFLQNGVPVNPTYSYAAYMAKVYNGGGYSDWYLPSKDELAQLYDNRIAIGGFQFSNLGDCYVSSSESTSTEYWAHNFYNASQLGLPKTVISAHVRAVRTF